MIKKKVLGVFNGSYFFGEGAIAFLISLKGPFEKKKFENPALVQKNVFVHI